MTKLPAMMILLLVALPVLGSDLAREARIAEQISEALLDGEAITLKAGDTEFMAIFTATEQPETRGAAILLHGFDANPDWTEVIQPLRTRLIEHGWDTLSLQMPVTSGEGELDGVGREQLISEAKPRIEAAIAFLKQRNNLNQVLIGHSFGAEMGVRYLADSPAAELRGMVAIGLNGRQPATLEALKKIKLPLLDLYGSQDLGGVLRSARARARAAKDGGNEQYRQVRVEGADHFFNGLDDSLLVRVRSWMSQYTAGTEQPVK